ncbi:MAG: DUF3617 domain-containing protein [Rhodanobacteraceae bacterium]
MSTKTRIGLAGFGVLLAAMVVVPAWAGSGNDKLMHMTMHMTMHMSGMPALQPRTIQRNVCMPAGKFDADALNRATSKSTRSQCSVEHYAKHGSEITYDVICKAPEAITSHAVIHLADGGGFTGKMHTTANAGGHAMTMNSDYNAKRVGNCTYKSPKGS